MRSGRLRLYILLISSVAVALSLIALSFSQPYRGGEAVVIIPKSVSHMPYGSTFWPSTIKVVIGINNTVRWVNMDDHMHTVTAIDWSFYSDELNLYDEFVYTFTRAGVYKYRCLPHPWMVGVVEVYEP